MMPYYAPVPPPLLVPMPPPQPQPLPPPPAHDATARKRRELAELEREVEASAPDVDVLESVVLQMCATAAREKNLRAKRHFVSCLHLALGKLDDAVQSAAVQESHLKTLRRSAATEKE